MAESLLHSLVVQLVHAAGAVLMMPRENIFLFYRNRYVLSCGFGYYSIKTVATKSVIDTHLIDFTKKYRRGIPQRKIAERGKAKTRERFIKLCIKISLYSTI